MAHLVFIRQINPNTFLHLAVRGTAFCLRDYPNANAPVEVGRQNKGRFAGKFAQDILDAAHRDGNQIFQADAVPYSNANFWHEHIRGVNRENLTPPPPPPPPLPQPREKTTFMFMTTRGGISGTLRGAKETVSWIPSGHTSGYSLSWQQFQQLFQKHGNPTPAKSDAPKQTSPVPKVVQSPTNDLTDFDDEADVDLVLAQPPGVSRSYVLWVEHPLADTPRFVHFSYDGQAFRIRDYLSSRLQYRGAETPEAPFHIRECPMSRDQVWESAQAHTPANKKNGLNREVAAFAWWKQKLGEMTRTRSGSK